MKTSLLFFFFCCASILVKAQNKIILKLDDIGVTKGFSAAVPIMDYLLAQNIKASYGVIARNLDETAGTLFEKYIKAKNAKGENMIEFWHHGYDHSNTNPPANNQEFKGTTYEFQKEHFEKADALVKSRLGVQMHAFGSPYNAVDSNTLKIIAANPNYKAVMLFYESPAKEPQLVRLNNRVNLEKEVGNPELASFIVDYEKNIKYEKSYMILQGHPNQWNEAKIAQFKLIIDYLIAKKCEFILPSDIKN